MKTKNERKIRGSWFTVNIKALTQQTTENDIGFVSAKQI